MTPVKNLKYLGTKLSQLSVIKTFLTYNFKFTFLSACNKSNGFSDGINNKFVKFIVPSFLL